MHINYCWKVVIFHSTHIRNIKHPASSTKTYPSYREPVGLVKRHLVINAFNYKITRSARINGPSLSRHLVSSRNLILRMFWLEVVYKELYTASQQELSVCVPVCTNIQISHAVL